MDKQEKPLHTLFMGIFIIVFGGASTILAVSLDKSKNQTANARADVMLMKTKIDIACQGARIRSASLLYELFIPSSEVGAARASLELAGWMPLCDGGEAYQRAIMEALSPPRHDVAAVSEAVLEFSRGKKQ